METFGNFWNWHTCITIVALPGEVVFSSCMFAVMFVPLSQCLFVTSVLLGENSYSHHHESFRVDEQWLWDHVIKFTVCALGRGARFVCLAPVIVCPMLCMDTI